MIHEDPEYPTAESFSSAADLPPTEPGAPAATTAAPEPAPAPSSPSATSMPTRDERLWALAAYLVGRLLPIIGPAGIYVARRDDSRFVAFHAKQALLLDVGVLAAVASAFALAFLLQIIPLAGTFMARLLVAGSWVLLIAWLLGGVVLAIQAFDGQRPRFPLFAGCCGLGEERQ